MAEVLLVGEDRDRLRSLLRKDGHKVTWLRSSGEWPEVEREVRPELIVAVGESVNEMLSVPGETPRGFPAPLLFVQHESDLAREVSLEDRLVDRIHSPFMADELLARVDALARVRRVVRRERESEAAASGSKLGALRQGIGAFLSSRVPRAARPSTPYLEVAARVAEWADHRDRFVEPGHAGRVASFSAMMADRLDMSDREVEVLLRAAMLHDIGKVTLPAELLRYRGPLDDEKMRLVRTHAERGAQLLRALDPDDEAARVVLYHHERPDGSGYFGKKQEGVPRAARVLAVAEAYDAMTATRWSDPVPSQAALGVMKERRGESFDADSVDALLGALRPRPTRILL